MKAIVTDTAFALGWKLIRPAQTRDSDVRDLISKLRPLNCGKALIRVGGERDGGYLLPDDLEGIEYCFSPGVGPTADFESHLATLNIKSFLADYSVDSPPIRKPEFTFDKKFLGANDSETCFTLKSWLDKYVGTYKGALLLQMDIEGSEYEVILSTPTDVLKNFRIMVIEFHFLDKMFDPFVYTVFRACFEKILKDFHVAHIHPNNCCGSVKTGDLEVPRVVEFTFYNKNRVAETKHTNKFPHALDRDNKSATGPLHLPKCWYI
jgi:hypothetical protein